MDTFSSILTPEQLAYLAGAFYVTGLAITNQIALRLLILGGTGIYVWYYAIASATPLWEAIFVSLLIGVANLGGLTSLLVRQSRLAIPREHSDIYDSFSELPPGDFRALMMLAKRYKLGRDKQVTFQGMPGCKLYFVVNGSTLIKKNDEVFTLPPKIFLGEIAFLTGSPSSASAWLEEGAEVLEWDFQKLKYKCQRHPRFRLALEAAISMDLASKVARSVGHGSKPVEKIPKHMFDAVYEVSKRPPASM